MVNIRQFLLFLLFIGFSVGSVLLMTAAFKVPPLTIYAPPLTVEPVEVTGVELGRLMALGAAATLYLLIKERR